MPVCECLRGWSRRASLALGWCALLAGSLCPAQEWTRFRGPNGSGLGQGAQIPVKWTLDELAWKTKLPGRGHSSPVLWGDRLFVTSADEASRQRYVLALDATTDKELWHKEFAAVTHEKHRLNSFASSTPAVDAERLYVTWGTSQENLLIALNHEGQEVWKRDLGPFQGGHGSGTSPLIWEDFLILGNDQDGGGFLAAYDRKSGDERWKLPRQSKQATYATPCVWQPPGQPAQLVFTDWHHGITGVDAKTGQKIWELDVWDDAQKRAIGSPIASGDFLIATCGFYTGNKFLVALRPDLANADRPPQLVYQLDRLAPHIPTPLALQDRLYLWGDKGVVACTQLATGETVWSERVPGTYFSSPVSVNGRIYNVTDQGEVVVLAAADRLEVLARNPLGEGAHSSPAIARGRLYFHTFTHVIAVGPGPAAAETK